MGYSMGWFAFWDIELASSSIQYRALGTTKGGYRHASSKAMGHTRGYRRACSEAMGRRSGYRVALPRGPGHLRSTSARLLKSHGPKIRILNCASLSLGHLRWISARLLKSFRAHIAEAEYHSEYPDIPKAENPRT